MRGLLSRRPSPAMIVAILALVMAMVGTGYAAFKLPKNSVGTKQLKKNSVTAAKIKKNAVTSAKVKNHTLTGADINLAKLGTVPSAATANTVPPREGLHLVGASGEPGFAPGTTNFPSPAPGLNFQPVGFFRDHDEVVHLEGVAKVNNPEARVFELPAGFRLANGVIQIYEPNESTTVFIAGPNVSVPPFGNISNYVLASEEAVLSGITFRAQN
jgi:hypothetical protein